METFRERGCLYHEGGRRREKKGANSSSQEGEINPFN